MASSDEQELPDPPDWELLSATFARGGEHRHKMGLRRGDASQFYAATTTAPEILRQKRVILDRDGEQRTVVTREGHDAAVEFSRLLGLPTGEDGPDGEEGWRSHNRKLALSVEPDLLLVQPPDWSLVWANVCFPSRWSLEDKARRPLSWIHDAVPGLNAELGSKISAFFSRLVPGEGWRRANWGLSASCRKDQHPAESGPSLGAATPPEEIYIRVEDQHLLKLSETGAIAFGIRITSFAWTDIRQNGAIAKSLLEQLQSMSPEVADYKGLNDVLPSMTEEL